MTGWNEVPPKQLCVDLTKYHEHHTSDIAKLGLHICIKILCWYCHYLNQCWLSLRCCGIHPRAISHKMLKISIFYMSLKITYLTSQTQSLRGQGVYTYRQVSNIRCTLVGNIFVDHSDVVEHRLSALLQLYLHSRLNIWLQGIRQRKLQDTMRIF